MFGREYANHLDVLADSFKGMRKEYGGALAKTQREGVKRRLECIYIRIFGIPEIGFQLRSLHFRHIMGRYLADHKSRRILDAGSGIGAYAFLLTKWFPQAEVIGYEIDDAKLRVCADIAATSSMRQVDFARQDLTERMATSDRFDLVISIDVLEHIDDYEAVLDNFASMLSLGGHLFLHTPQPDQRRIFKRLSTWSHQDHVREGFLPSELRPQLLARGFSVVECRETFGLFGKVAWELNHLVLAKSLALGAITFPLLYLLGTFDLLTSNHHGLGMALLVTKR